MARAWNLVLLACAVALVGASREIEAIELADANTFIGNPKLGMMSLAQLRENALMAVRGEEALTDEMAEKAKHAFVKLAASFKSDTLRADSISTVRLAQHLLLGEGAKAASKAQAQGSGLDLIFRKLNELKKKIENEQGEEKTQNVALNNGCQKSFKDNNAIIGATSTTRSSNANTISKADHHPRGPSLLAQVSQD